MHCVSRLKAGKWWQKYMACMSYAPSLMGGSPQPGYIKPFPQRSLNTAAIDQETGSSSYWSDHFLISKSAFINIFSNLWSPKSVHTSPDHNLPVHSHTFVAFPMTTACPRPLSSQPIVFDFWWPGVWHRFEHIRISFYPGLGYYWTELCHVSAE